MSDPLEDRRQAAREAAYVATANSSPYYELKAATEAAIESATQVKITQEVISAGKPVVPWLTEAERIKRVFEAAGFEVVE